MIFTWIVSKFPPKHLVQDFIKRIRFFNVIPEGYTRLDLERAGNIYIPEEQADTVGAVVKFIQGHTQKSDYIYDFSNKGLYYFLADRRNPTRYSLLIYASTPEEQEGVVRDLVRHKPKYVLFEDSDFGGIRYTKRFPVIWEYIEREYTAVFEKDDFYILGRGKTNADM